MSHGLPSEPSLEYLKKQAKHRLREVQRRDPGTRLADALHVIAKEHGFATWPQLKSHIDALPPSECVAAPAAAPQPEGGGGGGGGSVQSPSGGQPPNYAFNRYTERLKRATFFSRFEAAQLGSATIEPEHVLLGVIHAQEGLATPVSAGGPLVLGKMRAEVANRTAVRAELANSVVVPFSAASRHILQQALGEADRLGHQPITTGHFLVALLLQRDTLAAVLMHEAGVELAFVRNSLASLVKEESPTVD